MSPTPFHLLWLLFAPLALGLLAWVRPPRHSGWVLLVALPLPLLALWLLLGLNDRPMTGQLALGPLTLHWRLDGLAALLWLLTQLLLLASALYAAGYVRTTTLGQRAYAWLWPLMGGLALGLGLIWIAADLLLLYAGLELMGLCAVGMMLLPGSVEALTAGLRYLLFALVGSLTWLLGVALLLGAWGRLDLAGMAGLAAVTQPDPVTQIAVALLASGLLLKAAIFPLHSWLAPVHGSAWTPVSAIHGALVVKASFFILLLLWRALLPEAIAGAWALGLLGSLAVLWGGIQAWRAVGLKQLVAWSTVGQLGYLMLAFPLLAGTSAAVAMMAWQATWLQLAGHALAKAAMFMAAGNLLLSTGAHRLEGLTGTSRRLPLSLMTFGLAAVTLMGLPPSAGFTAKWLWLQASLASGQWLWVVVLALGSLLSAIYVFRVLRCSFVEDAPEQAFRSLPLGMELIALVLALAAIGLGLAAGWPLSFLGPAGVS
ncbi:complex I subunit 5 family protein [Halochromatium roseum]|uniref:complex I subunit 5 family protein n=1 Tax=Halochromatium roseum TaxID=391920 RepID=UPI00191157E0|nr:proton-conducting transporter membrane subunit [Halochromatium roseum]MBK5942176.1 NADH-ubiquinone oxidoreductase [Halochromatium roseum]